MSFSARYRFSVPSFGDCCKTTDASRLLISGWIESIDQRPGRIEARIDSIDSRLNTVSEHLVKVETKLEGGHVVLSRS